MSEAVRDPGGEALRGESGAGRAGWLAGGCLFAFVALALAAPVLPLPAPAETDLAQRLAPPGTAAHWLGTDHLGRDVLSRLVHGTRASLAVGAAGTAVAAFFGTLLGLVAGFFGRRTDTLVMRAMDVLLAFPYLLLALALVAVLGPGLRNAALAIAIVNVPFFARTVRGATVGLAHEAFVDVARLSGRSNARILATELLPNVAPIVGVATSTTLGWMVLETAGLSFLGLGAQPPQADLGSMLADGRRFLTLAPHLALAPGLAIFVLTASVHRLGDVLRDRLDPRHAGAPAPRTASEATAAASDAAGGPGEAPLLAVEDLRVAFAGADAPVLRGVGLELGRGESLALVGESGSGKTLTALSLLGLLPPGARVTGGSVRFEGEALLGASPERLRALRGRRMAWVPQDPGSALNPLLPVDVQVGEGVWLREGLSRAEARERARALLEQVRFPEPERRGAAWPHELSGGMRQRALLAMALAESPELLVADEPTTALDVTVQAEILALLEEIRRERGLALLLVSHDLGVVARLCERVLVMRRGEIVEAGPVERVLVSPEHPYTRELVESVPRLAPPERAAP